MKKKTIKILCIVIASVLVVSGAVTGIILGTKKGGTKKDSIVIMSEELSGLFNPFYATTGADMEVIGLTQIGMLTTDEKGNAVAGDEYPTTVVKDFDKKKDGSGNAIYTFVIKNGLKFSDGEPLTMNDVLFNMYEYLDPVYTGSSTMYSIKIKGLTQYRTQKNFEGEGSDEEDNLSQDATVNAYNRRSELIDLFTAEYDFTRAPVSYTRMKELIEETEVSEGYMNAVASTEEQKGTIDYNALLLADYELARTKFKEELESDYKSAKESFDLNSDPYKAWKDKFSNDVFKFLYYEGYIKPVYKDVQGKKDMTTIVSFEGENYLSTYNTQEKAINKVFNDKMTESLDQVLTMWGTATNLMTVYTAEAKDILLKNNMGGDTMKVKNISGIKSLGHIAEYKGTEITVNNKKYTVASSHDEKGRSTNDNEYDVLQITLDGADPKAIFSFGFTVAPQHYYATDDNGNTEVVDIENNKFGLKFADSYFQSYVIQSKTHQEVPLGAGPYMATDKNKSDTPKGTGFFDANVVYYKANENFPVEVKTKDLRFQVVSSTNAIDKLKSGEVDFITPQFTNDNYSTLSAMEKSGYKVLQQWQLGYGYIGINAGKIPNIYLRRAIMSAMDTSLALEFYAVGTCKNISYPISQMSWAYPFEQDGVTEKRYDNNEITRYLSYTTDDDAINNIKYYMNLAGVSKGDSSLKITFTIAGASITEHPTYSVFKKAATLLNECGWNIEVKPDSQALTKLSTGSLEVWAAAWGSGIDPDMYQIYHKNSSATSVYAWGYREILSQQGKYPVENQIISDLSEIIDDARSITVDVDGVNYTTEADALKAEHNQRASKYKEALELVLELAVEMPVYQRENLYAYNANTLRGINENINAYTSPLERIWEIELVK